jgi:hypothetical protein
METDEFMSNFDFYAPDHSRKRDEENRDDNGLPSVAEFVETDRVEELINNVIASTPEEEFITENYRNIKKTALMFLNGRVDQEEFLRVVREMKTMVIEARADHEEAPLLQSEWTVEVAAGDRLLMEGLNGYEEALTLLEESVYEKNEEMTKSGIDMVYEANKKLVLNQCLFHYVENIAFQIRSMPPFF